MAAAAHDSGRDARIRRWIMDQATELIRQSPLGVTLGLLVTALKGIKNRDLHGLSEEGFYHRVHRALGDLVEEGVIRKERQHYFYQDPSVRIMAGLENMVGHIFPGAKLRQEDLASLRAALEGLEADHKSMSKPVAASSVRKPRQRKFGTQID